MPKLKDSKYSTDQDKNTKRQNKKQKELKRKEKTKSKENKRKEANTICADTMDITEEQDTGACLDMHDTTEGDVIIIKDTADDTIKPDNPRKKVKLSERKYKEKILIDPREAKQTQAEKCEPQKKKMKLNNTVEKPQSPKGYGKAQRETKKIETGKKVLKNISTKEQKLKSTTGVISDEEHGIIILVEDKADEVAEDSDITEDTDTECLDIDEIIQDITNPNIYVKKVRKSKTSAYGKCKKTDRVYDSYHRCPFCDKLVSNFSQHYESHNEDDDTLNRIKALKTEKDDVSETANKRRKERDRLFDLVRYASDNVHNVSVLKKKRGEILLDRRPSEASFDVSQYGPCPQCLSWIKKTVLARHSKLCPNNKADFHQTKGALITSSDVLAQRIPSVASKSLMEVFAIMRNDKYGKRAKRDQIIIMVGNMWMDKNVGNILKRGNLTSAVIRLLGRLTEILIESCSIEGCTDPCLADYIDPQYFDAVCKAALLCAKNSMDDVTDLDTPSNALKLGYDLKRAAGAKLGLAIKNKDDVHRRSAKDFLRLMDLEWSTRVTKLARVTLNERTFNNDKKLPTPSDIKKLNVYLEQEIGKVDLNKPPVFSTYQRAVFLSETKLTVYNRRRTGEVEAIK